jgi:hypothetical protein
MRQIYAYGIAEELLKNPELVLDFDGGRINLRKLEKELKNNYGYSLADIDATPIVYLIIDKLLERQRGCENPEVILDFGCGFSFEKITSIPEGVWMALTLIKGQDRIRCIKIATDIIEFAKDFKFFYGEEAVEQKVEAGTVWKEMVPDVTAVYSNYYGVYIHAYEAVRVYNPETGQLDWVKECDATSDISLYPKGFRILEKQARWIPFKGYVPKGEAVKSSFADNNYVWKYDPDIVFTGKYYVPREVVKKYFVVIDGEYYRRRTLKVFCSGVDHWGLHMFRPNGVKAIKEKIRAKYKGLTVLKAS